MDIMEAMQRRHSVRAYTDRKIEGAVKEELEQFIAQCNADGNLHMQLILNEPRAFASKLNHYGMFSNVKNYVAIVGKPAPDFDERCGYYGEKCTEGTADGVKYLLGRADIQQTQS